MKGPYLFIAFACPSMPEDGKMDVHNLPGKLNVEGDAETMPSFPLNLTLFIGLIAGEYTGKAQVSVKPVSPSKEEYTLISEQVEFKKPFNHRVHIKVSVEDFTIKQQGVYWFDVHLENSLITRIPIEVIYRRVEKISQKHKTQLH